MGISSKYQKDYSNATFDNPRLLKKREDRKLLLIKIFLAMGGALSATLLYFLFYSQFFKINSFEISGLKKIKEENISNIINNYLNRRRFIVFSHGNYWLVDKEALRAEIYKYYYLESLEIKRKFPNKLVLTVTEKQPMINWAVKELCFHVDMTGTAIGYCEGDAGMLTVRSVGEAEVSVGKVVINPEELKEIIDLHEQTTKVLKDHFIPLYYELNGRLITCKLDGGPELRFNLDLGIGEQIGRLDILMRSKDVKDNYQKLKYIDLRFGDKVFYQ